jgi:hypothetical protein
MIITQCYLRLNARHLSKVNRNKILTDVFFVYGVSNCHNISICSICEAAKYTWVNFLVKLEYIPSQITTK